MAYNQMKITVNKNNERPSGFQIRLYIDLGMAGVIRLASAPTEFSKREADYRAMILSSCIGAELDELPSHPETEAYPKFDD